MQDFTSVARSIGVSVGPGRGSAAGSCVAYCLGITNIDPIKYDLLFERFLNPERVSMPDIDIDFDDDGRDKVINYVMEKYGKNQVAQIVTYGTMAAKSSLRDVGRVMNIPLSEVDRIAKSFPSHLNATLKAVLAEKDVDPKLKEQLSTDDKEKAMQFRQLAEEKGDIGQMIRTAKQLEGSVRNTGIHACGVIITPGDITDYIPVSLAKDSELLVSQYDNSVAEEAGLLKMDFLGLKTLTIIKDAIEIIEEKYSDTIDIDNISLEDEKTFELFQNAEMAGIFQFESIGMQKYLKDLAPTNFEQLIAMVALYRPGPLQYLPNFIARKHGQEKTVYDLPEMEEYLQETYGITVYQEQVMLLSQKLAGFSKGEADVLRKAMGKKQKAELDKMFPKFLEGCKNHGHDEEIAKKIWSDWEAFASYAFNKSHATCYAYIAFQTAFLKAHYPAAYMAAVLNHNKNDISKIDFYLQDTKRMGIKVLGPDINESNSKFTVNSKGQIRFGLSALKGVGEGPVDEIVNQRRQKGPFQDVYDMMRRLNLRAVNKKCMDSLVLGGAFDSFENIYRAQYFEPDDKNDTFIESLLRYGANFQAQRDSNQLSLFGDSMTNYIETPKPSNVPEWNLIDKLEKEKEVTGIYISGHPLDDYHLEFKNFINCSLDKVDDVIGSTLKLGGIVTDVVHAVNQKGNGYGRFTIQDFVGSTTLSVFNEQYLNFKHLLEKGNVIYVEGMNEKGYNSDRYFFRVKNIKMLDTVGTMLTKSITLKLSLDQITEVIAQKIETLCISHPGPHGFKIKLVDADLDIELDLLSSSHKVKVDNELVNELSNLQIPYKIN